MADNSQKQIQDQIKLLEIQKNRIQANKTLSVQDKEQIKQIDALIKKEQVRLNRIKQTIKAREDEAKSFDSFAKSYRKLSNDVQKQLAGSSKQSGVYLSIGRAISKEVGIQTKYAFSTKASEKELADKAAARQSKLTDISSELLNQAKATQKAEDNLRGVSDVDREILDIQESKGLYSAAQKAQMIAAIKQTEQLRLKEERLNTIAEERKGIFDALPGPIQDMVSGAKKFGNALKNGALPMVLLATVAIAALTSFTKLDESAKSFRETTGLTNSQMADIKSQANDITGQFATMGVDAEKVFNTVAGLKSEFSDIATFGDEVVAGLTLLNTNFGVSADSAAKVQGVFEQIGGLTSETAAGVQLQVANMAKLAGVAPAKIFEDIAENAEIASTLFQGDVESLATAAIEARRLGTNLKSVASTTEHLLDFQSNIGDELVAATFVGGQFNLTQARSLAAAGKSVEAQKEVLRQLQRGGDFRKKDYFTQQQLAKAAGMSVEEINKQLNAQEKLNSLSSEQRALAETAIQQGLDISNIDKEQLASQVEQFSKQQEMQSQVEQLKNAFMGIASTVGTVLTPLLQGLMPIIQALLFPVQLIAEGFKFFADNLALAIPLAAGLGIAFAPAIIAAISSAVGFIMSTFAMIPLGLGIPLGIAAVAGLFSMISKAKSVSQVGDLAIDPNGGPIISSPKEGGIFQGTKNDGISMGPTFGISGGVSNNSGISSQSEMSSTLANSGGGVGINMDAVVNELKALKEEFRKTKDVYMDGRKVTSNVGRTVDNSTKNNFSFGT
jgi:hypothetical protein